MYSQNLQFDNKKDTVLGLYNDFEKQAKAKLLLFRF